MSATKMPRVLIVEDEALIRLALVDEFTDEGFNVVEAGSADEAEAIMGDGSDIDAIVTDVEMPGELDGMRLAWLAHKRDPSIRVIVVSGRVRPTSGELPDGSLFHPKPYLMGRVVSDLREMLTSHA